MTSRFDHYSETDKEFITNSIFEDDDNKHLSINKETGLWQCFKSKERGNFEQLVAYLEGINQDAAKVFIGRKLLNSPELLFYKARVASKPSDASVRVNMVSEIAKDFKPLTQYSGLTGGIAERLAFRFAKDRHIPIDRLLFCEEGKYAGRVIIPYYRHDGSMFFFQARTLGQSKIKYMNPTEEDTGERGKASNIIFPSGHPDSNFMFVTEGPIDALTLQAVGIRATCINGSFVSRAQARLLKYEAGCKGSIILAYDNDKAGRDGMEQSAKMLASIGAEKVLFINPKDRYNDWNHMRETMNLKQMRDYCTSSIKKSYLEWKLISRLF